MSVEASDGCKWTTVHTPIIFSSHQTSTVSSFWAIGGNLPTCRIYGVATPVPWKENTDLRLIILLSRGLEAGLGPKGPKNDSPQILWCIWAQQKKNRVDCPKIGAVSPNSKLLPNGRSGRKANFQEISCSRRKFVVAQWFFDQST